MAVRYPFNDESLFGKLKYLAVSEPESVKKLYQHYESTVDLTLHGFRLTEIYAEDEIPKLLNAIQRKFGWKISDPDFINSVLSHPSSTGYSRVGSLSPTPFTTGGFQGETTQVKDLRREIERIDITFYKFLPSLIGLTFDVYLHKDARAEHKNHFLDRSPNGEIIIKSYYPSLHFFSFLGPTYVPASFSKTSTWINSLLVDTTRVIADLFGGLLSANQSNARKLPTIEIYIAQPEITQEKKWLDKNRHFLHAFGADPFNTFVGSGILFCWGDRSMRNNEIGNHKIILSPQLFFKKIKYVNRNQITPEYTHLFFASNLNDWAPFLCSIYLIEYLESAISWFKKEISRTANRIPGFGIQSRVKVLARFQKSYFLFRQFEKESEKFLSAKPTFSSMSNLAYVDVLNRLKTRRTIYQYFDEIIKWNKELLMPNFSILETFYSDYLSLVNSSVTNRLAQIAILIALFTLIFSLLSENNPLWRILIR
jgi:hypothetical protein